MPAMKDAKSALRKRLPPINPVCPIHDAPMLVRKTMGENREHACCIPGCKTPLKYTTIKYYPENE